MDLHSDALTTAPTSAALLAVSGAESSLPRLQLGDVGGQVFALWLDPRQPERFPAGRRRFFARLDTLLRVAPDNIALARTPDELLAAAARGRVGAVLAVEGADILGGDAEHLDRVAAQGVRVLTLTWNRSNEFADAALDSRRPWGGLSPAGQRLVADANRLGIIIDLAHAAESTFNAVLARSTRPVIVSHAGCRALVDHPRNLTDDQLRRLAAQGGMVGIIFHSPFLAPPPRRATLGDVADHIDHVVRLVGPDCVGFGSDFDGKITTPRGLTDASAFPALLDTLRGRGYSEDVLARIAGGNFLRVWRAQQTEPKR